MKKLLVILALVLCFAVVFTACGKNESEETTAAKTDAPTEAPTTEAVEDPTTVVEDPTTVVEDPTTVVEDPTTVVEDPTTDAGEEPTTDAGEEPTTDAGEEPTTDAGEEPTTDAGEEPTTDAGEEPTTEANPPAPCEHVDADPADHACDACGEVLGDCTDEDKDYVCDVCGEKLPIPGLKATGAGMASDDGYFENGTNLTPTGQANAWFSTNRATDGITGVDSIGFHGWAFVGDGKTVDVEAFGWALECEGVLSDITWDGEVILDEAIFAPLEGRTATRRYTITINLSALATGEYDVYLYVKFADGSVYQLDCFTDVWVNHVNSFEQNEYSATAQADKDYGLIAGNPLSETELNLGFSSALFATGDGTYQELEDGTPYWQFGGFFQTYQAATGKYFYTVDIMSATDGASAAFIRGTMGDNFGWDPGYFGEGGPGTPHTKTMGKAGIYYNVRGENLVIAIKEATGVADNGTTLNAPVIHEITVPNCTGNITVLDLGDVIYFKSGDKTVAKIVPVGSTSYGANEGLTESVTVTTWAGQEVTINNALVVADVVGSEFGFSNRIGTMKVTGFAFGSAAGIEYAANLDVATSVATDKPVYSEGEFIYVTASHKEAAYIGIYKAGTTDLVAFYEMGTAEGFADIPVGEYDVVIADMAVNVLKSVTITVNPATIVSTYGPADFMARPNTTFGATFGCTGALSEDGTYVTFTMDPDASNPAIGGVQGTDYNWYFAFAGMPGYELTASPYMVIKYRTEATNIDKQEMFIATTATAFAGPGSNINFTEKMVCDGEWNYLYINFEEYGITDANTMNILRFDLINGAPSGSTIDIEYINFYKTAEDAIKSTMEPKTYAETSDFVYTSNEVQVATADHAAFGPIVNAINTFNADKPAHANGNYAVNNAGLLWLGNGDNPVDLSKYSKAIITFTCDAGDGTKNLYNEKGNNKFKILNFNEVLAEATYTLPAGSWQWTTCEIDLSGVDYNGEVLFGLTDNGLAGTWYVIDSIVLVP